MIDSDNFLTRFCTDQAFAIVASVYFFLKYLKVNYITNHQGNANQNHNEISSHTIRMVIIKKIRKKINVGEDLGKKVLCIVNGNENWCSHYGKQYGGLSKN